MILFYNIFIFSLFCILQADDETSPGSMLASFIDVQNGVKNHVTAKLQKLIQTEPEDENLNHHVEGTINGDELLPTRNKNERKSDILSKRKTISLDYMLWPNGIIPWKFSSDPREKFHGKNTKGKIVEAIRHWEDRTCLRFIPLWLYPDAYKPQHYLEFTKGSGCASVIGYQEFYNQRIILNERGCLKLGIIVHEIGHTVGFYHEHARLDRDKFIKINSQNILGSYEENFDEAAYSTTSTMYDLGSDMHYGPKYFSVNGEDTISSIDPDLRFLMGRRVGLSFLDVKGANKAYNCSGSCSPDRVCNNTGFLLMNCSCYCPHGLTGDSCNEIDQQFLPECSKIIDLTFGENVVISDGGPHTKCFWLIKGEVGNKLKAELKLHLPSDTKNHICIQWLEARYYHIGQEGPRYCGSTEIPVNITSVTNMMSLILDTTAIIVPSNFSIKLQAVGPIDRKIQCVFSNKCPFYSDSNSQLQWKTLKAEEGPKYGLKVQPYLVVKSSLDITSLYEDNAATSKLVSADIKAGNWCFTFGYYMTGTEACDLAISIVVNEGPGQLIWEKTKLESSFKDVNVKISSRNSFKLLLSVSLVEDCMLALSKIVLDPDNKCYGAESTYPVIHASEEILWKCDFETDTCELHQCDGPYDMTWARMSAFPLFGPVTGHKSNKNSYGKNWFLVRNGLYKMRGSEACVMAPEIELKSKGCIEFYFYVWGFSTGSVTLNLIPETGEKKEIWSFGKPGLQSIEWQRYRVPITLINKFKLNITTLLKFWWGSFAIDDIKITNSSC